MSGCGSVFVVKYGGVMDSPDPEVRSRVAQDLVFLNFVGIKVVVVQEEEKPSPKNLKIVDWKQILLMVCRQLMLKRSRSWI